MTARPAKREVSALRNVPNFFGIYGKMLVLKTLGHSFGLFRLNLFGRSVQ
jgi:hypothetical protein